MRIQRDVFIAKVEEIAAEEPEYKQGHEGKDGYCDCIGLIIGAIRRAGGQWRGTHGSNYARRKEMATFEAISCIDDLEPGEAVYKSKEPSDPNYQLPNRYKPGHEDYNGDIRDYNHVGVVISVRPLRIRHMTTPKPKMDDKLGKWKWHGQLAKVDYGNKTPEEVIRVEPYQARVIGGALNLRKTASTASVRICQIPEGSIVTVIAEAGEWVQAEHNGLTGYCMARFLERMNDGNPDSKTITVDRMRLEAIYDELGDLLGLRG